MVQTGIENITGIKKGVRKQTRTGEQSRPGFKIVYTVYTVYDTIYTIYTVYTVYDTIYTVYTVYMTLYTLYRKRYKNVANG